MRARSTNPAAGNSTGGRRARRRLSAAVLAAGLMLPWSAVVGAAVDTVAVDESEPPQDSPPASAGEERERALPLFRDWFEQQGIDLPLPLGAGVMSIFMERDIEVTDVTVQFLDRPPESISDRGDFEVGNRTRSTAARFDA